MFGSVPLRTYLPDGDVDISLFCKSSRDQAAMRGAWAGRLLSALQWETRRGPLHLPIQDVQIIQAEVQLVKCIVAGVVVDISFDTIGGLCTVAFLESVDRLLGRGHLFKRSILLVREEGNLVVACWSRGCAEGILQGILEVKLHLYPTLHPSLCPARSRRGATTRAGCWARTTAC